MSRPIGSGTKWPVYQLQPGQAVTLRGSYRAITSAVCHARRSRRWTITQRKTIRGIEVRRHA